MGLFTRLFDHEYKELKKFNELAEKIMNLDEEYQKLTDNELNEFLCSYKKLLDDKQIKILICENVKNYEY